MKKETEWKKIEGLNKQIEELTAKNQRMKENKSSDIKDDSHQIGKIVSHVIKIFLIAVRIQI